MAKQKLTQAQANDLVKMLGTSANLDNIEIIDEPKADYDIDDLFGSNEDEYDRQWAAQKSSLAKSIAKDEAEQTEHDEMVAAGYKQVTTTEYEEEWDGEGGDLVTRTEWVKIASTTDVEEQAAVIYEAAHGQCYAIERAAVINGIVIRAWLHTPYAEMPNGNDLHHMMGLSTDDIIKQGFKPQPNKDLSAMKNNYQTGSTYHGLGAGHGNRNIPTLTFKRY